MAIASGNAAQVTNELRSDDQLRRVFNAIARINGGPLLRIAQMTGIKPDTVREKMDQLEDLGLVERTSHTSFDALSIDYYLTKLGYQVDTTSSR